MVSFVSKSDLICFNYHIHIVNYDFIPAFQTVIMKQMVS